MGNDEKRWTCVTDTRKLSLVVVVLALSLAVVNVPQVLNSMLQNIGFVKLAHSLTAISDVDAHRFVGQSETLFQRVVRYAPSNHSSWRGLGLALIVQGQEEEAVTAWQSAHGMVKELVQRGEEAQKEGRHQEALIWYVRAQKVQPAASDTWYAMGLAYEEMGQRDEALRAYEQAANASVFLNIGRSSPYYRQGMLYQWGWEPPRMKKALAAYDTAIETGHFTSDWEAANSHYRRGEILRWMGKSPEEYIGEYQRAIDLNPDFASAHVYLGAAYYDLYQDAVKAEAEIQVALVLQPGNQWAYYHLGEVFRLEGHVDDAIVAYQNALDIAPDFGLALERLQSLSQDRPE